jgi:nucleoside-diphosphate-sugar epimerase
MTILATGANGFVGAHTVAALARNWPGEEIVAADIAPPPDFVRAFWGAAPVVPLRLDIADRHAVAAAVAAHRPRFVVHMAAITPSPEMETTDPLRVVDINILGAANVLDAAAGSPDTVRIVLLSSSIVYGFGPLLPSPLAEGTALDPIGLYAVSKVACEGLARRYRTLRGKDIVAARVAATYGEMERPTAHRQTMSHIHTLFDALRARRPVTTTASPGMRDWTHADDIGEGICALLAAARLNHDAYNISRGVGLPWTQVLEMFRAAGADIRMVDDPAAASLRFEAQAGRPPMAVERLAADTGFRPARDLRDAIARVASGGTI